MDCPHCSATDAECIIGQFWKCKNPLCDNYDGPPVPLPSPNEYANYKCDTCHSEWMYKRQYVADGGRCKAVDLTAWVSLECGGILRWRP